MIIGPEMEQPVEITETPPDEYGDIPRTAEQW